MDPKSLVEKVTQVLEEKKAEKIEVIDIKELTTLTDYFVICSGTSDRHVKSLADAVEEKLLEEGISKLNKEGYKNSGWVLLDYDDVVVHIFRQEQRDYYNLERLWSDGVLMSRERDVME